MLQEATAEPDESLVRRWARRAISIPVAFLAAALLLASLPLLPLVALTDVVRGTRLAVTRTLITMTVMAVWEVCSITALLLIWIGTGGFLGMGGRACRRASAQLQNVWEQLSFGVVRRVFGGRVVLEGAAPDGDRPLLVFCRHASLADIMVPNRVLRFRDGWRLRYVVKDAIKGEPTMDIIGHRLPNRFIKRDGGATEREVSHIVSLTDGLGPREAVVIWPEGTRFTEAKRARAIARLRERGQAEAAAIAESFTHTMPPTRQGPLALLRDNPGADLLVIAHAGLEAAGSLPAVFRGRLVGVTLRIRPRLVRFEDIPTQPDEQARFLAELWREVDDYAREHGAEATAARRAAT